MISSVLRLQTGNSVGGGAGAKKIRCYCGCIKVIYGAVRLLLDHRSNIALAFVPLRVWQSSRTSSLYCSVQIVGLERRNTSTWVMKERLKEKKQSKQTWAVCLSQTEMLPVAAVATT